MHLILIDANPLFLGLNFSPEVSDLPLLLPNLLLQLILLCQLILQICNFLPVSKNLFFFSRLKGFYLLLQIEADAIAKQLLNEFLENLEVVVLLLLGVGGLLVLVEETGGLL
jgi:hypothetical protein